MRLPCQFDQQWVVLPRMHCGLLDKLGPRQRQIHRDEGIAHRRGRKSVAMACVLAILVESRQRMAILTAKL
jgi:hypothetical protein